jgi:glycosyltransferase involved in cell wall biosynthesis
MKPSSPLVLHVTNWRFRGGGTGVARVLFDADVEHSRLLCLEEDAAPGVAREVAPREYVCRIWDFTASHALVGSLLQSHGRIIVHSHGRRPGIHARLLRARYGRRVGVVHSFHGIASFHGLKKWLSALSESLLSFFTDRLIADGPSELELFRHLPLGCPGALIMPPYTPRNLARPVERVPERIGMAARLVAPKLQSHLIDAVAAYNRGATRPLRLVLAGDGPDAEALRAHGAAALGGNFELAGHVPSLAEFHASLDLYALFTRFEGLPLSLVDAMACGLPCIATDVIGNNNVIEHEKTGLLVPVGDTAAAAAALARLCADDELRRRLGLAAREAMERRHSPQGFVTAHQTLYAAIHARQGA